MIISILKLRMKLQNSLVFDRLKLGELLKDENVCLAFTAIVLVLLNIKVMRHVNNPREMSSPILSRNYLVQKFS